MSKMRFSEYLSPSETASQCGEFLQRLTMFRNCRKSATQLINWFPPNWIQVRQAKQRNKTSLICLGCRMSLELFGCKITIGGVSCLGMIDEDMRRIRVKPTISPVVGDRITCEEKQIDAVIVALELSAFRRWILLRYEPAQNIVWAADSETDSEVTCGRDCVWSLERKVRLHKMGLESVAGR